MAAYCRVYHMKKATHNFRRKWLIISLSDRSSSSWTRTKDLLINSNIFGVFLCFSKLSYFIHKLL